jgi:hypothetical protein
MLKDVRYRPTTAGRQFHPLDRSKPARWPKRTSIRTKGGATPLRQPRPTGVPQNRERRHVQPVVCYLRPSALRLTVAASGCGARRCRRRRGALARQSRWWESSPPPPGPPRRTGLPRRSTARALVGIFAPSCQTAGGSRCRCRTTGRTGRPVANLVRGQARAGA